MRDARPRRPLLSGVLLAVLMAHAALHVSGAETCEEEGSCSKDEEKGDKDSPEPAPDDSPYVCDFAEGLDFYERLGVPKDANERAIKKAFRKLSLTYHPDKVKGKTEEKECSQSHFIAITKAYETLSDEEKRRKVAI
jgi:DnaJ-domain-containing protein 1